MGILVGINLVLGRTLNSSTGFIIIAFTIHSFGFRCWVERLTYCNISSIYIEFSYFILISSWINKSFLLLMWPVSCYPAPSRWYLIFSIINIYISGPDIFRQFLVTLDMMPLISKFSSFYKGESFPWLLEADRKKQRSLMNEMDIDAVSGLSLSL